MKFLGSITVSGMSRFHSEIATKRANLAVMLYLRLIRFFFEPRMISDALHPILVRRFAVGSILSMRRFAQICDSIIVSTAIAMIDLILWPFIGHVKSCQPMFSIGSLAQFDVAIPSMVIVSSALSDKDFGARQTPRKYSSFRVVGENFSQAFMGNHGEYSARPRERLTAFSLKDR